MEKKTNGRRTCHGVVLIPIPPLPNLTTQQRMQAAIEEGDGMHLGAEVAGATFLFPGLATVEAGAVPVDGEVQRVSEGKQGGWEREGGVWVDGSIDDVHPVA